MNRRRIACAIVAGTLLSVTLGLTVAADWDLIAGDTARVAYTEGEGLNLRNAPGAEGEVVGMLPEDYPFIVQDTAWLDDGSLWYAVSVDTDAGWTSGWVHADFVRGDAWGGTFAFEGDAAASAVPVAVNSDGEPLNLRAAPWQGAEVLTAIPDGAWVEVLSPAVYDEAGVAWSEVRYDGVVGYAASAYLGYSAFGEGSSAADLAVGAAAVVSGTAGDGLNLRSAAGFDGAIVALLPEGEAGEVIDGPLFDMAGDAWYMLATQYGSGWAHSAYLADATGAQLARAASGSGAVLVDVAMEYLDVPYLWAGITPNGFDCSGYTYFLMSEILGYTFPRVIEDQLESGFQVSAGELLPGDLVFFQNTYTWGLSHVGIYIGGGRMISASGEHSAVGISDLNDPYWSARYLTARRVL